jgi:hypothetical protein
MESRSNILLFVLIAVLQQYTELVCGSIWWQEVSKMKVLVACYDMDIII